VAAVQDDESFYTRFGRLSAIITILPASMGAGWLLGYLLIDKVFGLFPWGSIVLTLLGAGAGFYEIVRLLMADRKQ
jgi:F0F1-type ATP synthase assembly protein I